MRNLNVKKYLIGKLTFKQYVKIGETIIKILRFLLPPFHPWKYKWIKYWYGEQSKNCWESTHKVVYKATQK